MIKRKYTLFLIALLLATPISSGWAILTSSTEILSKLTFAPVVEKTAPAVVNIYAKKIVRSKQVMPLFSDPLIRQFFGLDTGVLVDIPRVQQSLGSGVIVTKGGLIITNYHVVKGAREIKVVLDDRREFSAKLIKKDKRTDLAALKIVTDKEKKVDFPYIKLRDADTLKRGDIVLAIGNPFGLNHTVTSGIVSGLARTQLGAGDSSSFIQTDAQVNPGSSGGALVDLEGYLVGIVTAILTRSSAGGSIGLNFATPSNLIAPLIASAGDASSTKVIRPWVGADVQGVTQEMANALGYDTPKGVIIKNIYPEGPADEAGLKVSDVILEVGGKEIMNSSAFRYRISIQRLGSTVPFKVNRSGEEIQVDVKLTDPPGAAENAILLRNPHRLEGAVVVKLSPYQAYNLGIPPTEQGIVIVEIKYGSRAHRSRLFKPGDIILEINGHKITSAKKLDTLLARRSTRTIKLKRGDREIEISFR